MANFLNKLNTLVKASVNNLIDEVGSKVPRIPLSRLGKDIDHEIAALRNQIDAAISEEDRMQNQANTLQQQIDQYDLQIDEALKRNDDTNARYLTGQMQQTERQLTMLTADLEQHKRSTSDFIQRVSMLESMVADARREQEQKSANEAPAQEQSSSQSQPLPELSTLLREARERVQSMLNSPQPTQASPQSSTIDEGQPIHKIKINVEDTPSIEPPLTPKAADAALPVQPKKISIPITVDSTDSTHTESASTETNSSQAPTVEKLGSNQPSDKVADKVANDKSANEAAIEADLAKRRNRLSKPD